MYLFQSKFYPRSQSKCANQVYSHCGNVALIFTAQKRNVFNRVRLSGCSQRRGSHVKTTYDAIGLQQVSWELRGLVSTCSLGPSWPWPDLSRPLQS